MGIKLGLVGKPIKHSLSPWIHHQFLETMGMDGEYKLYETVEDRFQSTIDHLKEIDINGFNITVPYKQTIIPYLDELNPDAARIGAVNTVANKNGKWIGYNTDGKGYIRSVKLAFPDVFSASKKVLVLGAGGAARGIYSALMAESFKVVDIANRTISKAEKLLDLTSNGVETNIITFQDAETKLHDYDFIIQTTSVGMKPGVDDQVISLRNIKGGAVVSDIVYQPLMTRILQSAKEKGAFIHQGHTMLLYQAQFAFEIWTGKNVPADEIKVLLEQKLGGK